jgi:ubiquitin-conjugating enzyme E2 E
MIGIFICADVPLVMSIAHQYLTDRAKHDEIAAEWTMRFAR